MTEQAASKRATFARVMDCVARTNAAECESFTQNCRGYGKVPCASESEFREKGDIFYRYLLEKFGTAATTEMIPDLLQLVPDAQKRRALSDCHSRSVRELEQQQLAAACGGEDADELFRSDFGNAAAQLPTVTLAGRTGQNPVVAPATSAAATAAAQAPRDGSHATSSAATGITTSSTRDAEATSTQPVVEEDPLGPLVTELRALDVWSFDSSDCAAQKEALRRCTQYVEGMCRLEESVIKAWHVYSINEWGKQQARVLVLCTRSYFRMQFDVNTGRIAQPITRMSMSDLTFIDSEDSAAGPALIVHSRIVDGRSGPFSKAGRGGGNARTYAPVVPKEGPQAEAVAAEMVHAFERVREQASKEGESAGKLAHFRRLMIQGIEVYRHFPCGTGSDSGRAKELWVLHLDSDGRVLMLGKEKNHKDALRMGLAEIRSVQSQDPASDTCLRFVIAHPVHNELHIEVDTPKSRRIVTDLMNKMVAGAKQGT
eukprot:g412.t1